MGGLCIGVRFEIDVKRQVESQNLAGVDF